MKSRSRDGPAAKGSVRLVMCSQLLTDAFLGCLIIPVPPVTHASVRPCQVLAHTKSTDIVICHTFIFICEEIDCVRLVVFWRKHDSTNKNREIQGKAKRTTHCDPCACTLRVCIYRLLTKSEVKMAGYWLLFFVRVYGPRRSRGQ